MKITFLFNGQTSKLFLTPESPRDERCLELLTEGKPQVQLGSSKEPKTLSLEFSQQ